MAETPVTKFFSSASKTKSHVCALSLDMTGNCMICAIERERDEALMDRANGDIATMTINHYERILKERNEAIRQRNETNESSKYAVDCAIRERDEARHKLELCMAANSDVARIAKERDEARAELEMWRDGNILHEVHRDELEKAERERDEAQKKLASIYQWVDRNHPDGFIDSQTYFQNLERVVDNWYDRLDRLEVDANRFVRERDEARKDASHWKSENEKRLS